MQVLRWLEHHWDDPELSSIDPYNNPDHMTLDLTDAFTFDDYDRDFISDIVLKEELMALYNTAEELGIAKLLQLGMNTSKEMREEIKDARVLYEVMQNQERNGNPVIPDRNNNQ